MTGFNRTNHPTTDRRSTSWTCAFLWLLALLQLALVPVLNGRDVELAPLFQVDGLGLLFGTAWTLTLAVISIPVARQSKRRKVDLLLVLIGVGLVVYAYAQNILVLFAGWALVGAGIVIILEETEDFTNNGRAMRSWLDPAGALAIVAILTGLRAFTPPAGGVAEPWLPLAVGAATLAVLFTAARGFVKGRQFEGQEEGQRPNAPLVALYALAAPCLLAKMLVAAPWHLVGSWLLVLVGMLVVLGSAYLAYASQQRDSTQSFASTLAGVSIVGFGIAANSPLAAVGATWVMLMGLPYIVVRGWRWAEVVTLLGMVPGLWMVSQAALDAGYEVVAALLLPAYVLVAALTIANTLETARDWRLTGIVAVALSLLAIALPQVVVETMLRPAVRTMAGGVGALTTLGVDWGVGMLVRTLQGTAQAALPATGVALAVFLAAVVLYWLKQLAGRATRQADGDAQAE
ncbi:MAG: hypothetical protein M3441_08670 [Chloroflexota bacterium]|nr:hypothetical protein [Chloroflexota bacterium]